MTVLPTTGTIGPVVARSNKYMSWKGQPLGQMPDGELAEILGVAKRLVAKARQSRKVPAYSTSPKTDPRPEVDWSKSNTEISTETGWPCTLAARVRTWP